MAMLVRRHKQYIEAVETTSSATASKASQKTNNNLISSVPSDVSGNLAKAI